jgi:hypothetical protein
MEEGSMMAEEIEAEVEVEEDEIEVIDDRPVEDQVPARDTEASSPDWDISEDEINEYGGKVKERLSRLKYERHEERRAKEQAQRLSEEATRAAQVAMHDKQQLLELIDKGNQALFEVSQAKSDAELAGAEKEYREAYEAGDTDRVMVAQRRLNELVYDKKRFEELRPEPQPQATPQQALPPNEAAPQPPIDPDTVAWLQRNPWFGPQGNPEMTGFAYGVDQKLRAENFVPGSPEYFSEVDKRMRMVFPDNFEDAEESRSSAPRKSVVAPASRGGKASRKVTLTATQVDLAKRLGLTKEQYAKQLARDMEKAQ